MEPGVASAMEPWKPVKTTTDWHWKSVCIRDMFRLSVLQFFTGDSLSVW